MKINWSQVMKFVPQILGAVDAAETLYKRIKSGKEKKAAVMDAIDAILVAGEALVDKDIVKDAKVKEALSNFIDAYVSLQNAVKAAKDIPNREGDL